MPLDAECLEGSGWPGAVFFQAGESLCRVFLHCVRPSQGIGYSAHDGPFVIHPQSARSLTKEQWEDSPKDTESPAPRRDKSPRTRPDVSAQFPHKRRKLAAVAEAQALIEPDGRLVGAGDSQAGAAAAVGRQRVQGAPQQFVAHAPSLVRGRDADLRDMADF